MPMPFSRRVLVLLPLLLIVLAQAGDGFAASKQPQAPSWRFSGHALLAVWPDGDTEPALESITHVRGGALNGSGSFERPYGSIAEAVCAVSARATPQTLYIWGGEYVSTGAMIVRTDLTIAGSGTPLPLPSGATLPAQTMNRPVWRAAELHLSACEVSRGSVSSHTASYCRYDDNACGGLLLVADKRKLRLIGLTLAGDQNGAAVVMGSEPGLLTSGPLEMTDCSLRGFALGVYSNGHVSLTRGNSFLDMLSYPLGSNGHPSDTIRIGDNNRFSGNRRGIYAPNGVIVIGSHNDFFDNADAAVHGWDVRVGGGNAFSRNKAGLCANGSLHLGENNTVTDNAGDGLSAPDMRVGDRNAITGNGGKGLVLTAPLNKEQKPGTLTLGNRNSISDNRQEGILSLGGDVFLGNDNLILRNARAKRPAPARPGIDNRDGDVILGHRNQVADNAQYGIVASKGRIALGRDNRVTGNSAGGLKADEAVELGGGNVITGNSRGSGEDVRVRARNALTRHSSDSVGGVSLGW